MPNDNAVNSASVQVKALSQAVAADPTIPAAHKNVLQTIFSFLLNLAPFILEVFLGDNGEIPEGLANPIPTVNAASLETPAAEQVAQHPITNSLSAVMHTVATASPQNKGVLDKVFAFVLKILPTILGLFSHGPAATAPAAASATGAGNGDTTGGGSAPGAAADAGGVPLAGGAAGAGGAGVAAASSN